MGLGCRGLVFVVMLFVLVSDLTKYVSLIITGV